MLGVNVYSGAVYGTNLFLFNVKPSTNWDFSSLENYIKKCQRDNHIQDIEAMFWVSNSLVISADLLGHQATIDSTTFQYFTMRPSNESYAYETIINKKYDTPLCAENVE